MAARIPVSLSEILEVRSGGLEELEAWSVLGQGLEPLERLIENAKRSSVGYAGLSPDSIFFLYDGSVQLKPWPCHSLSDSLSPPEYGRLNNDGGFGGDLTGASGVDLNKAYVYAFGAVMNYALKWDTMGSAASSPELYSVLNLMTLAEPSARLPLAKIAQIVQNQLQQRNIDAVKGIQDLYRLIMGSNDDVSDFADLSPPPQQPVLVVDTAISPMSPRSIADPTPAEAPSEPMHKDSKEMATSPFSSGLEDHHDHAHDESILPSAVSISGEDLFSTTATSDFVLEYEKDESKLTEIEVESKLEVHLQPSMYANLSSEDDDEDVVVEQKVDVREELLLDLDTKAADPWQEPKNDQPKLDDVAEWTKTEVSRKESELLLLSELESPIGHSTALDQPPESHEHSATGAAVIPSPSDDEWSKKPPWVIFDGESNAGEQAPKTEPEVNDPDLFWMETSKPAATHLEESTLDFTTGSSARSKSPGDAFSSQSSEDMDDSVFASTTHTTTASVALEKSAPHEPTFFDDPFSFDDHEKRLVAVPADIDNINFGLAFQSDPTSPEKTDRSTKDANSALADEKTGAYRSSLTDTKRLQILEKLMPTDSSTFTNPKDHGELESMRSFHSVDCAFCSPQRNPGEKSDMTRRCSLHRFEVSTMEIKLSDGSHLTKATLGVDISDDETETLAKSFTTGLLLTSPKHDDDSLFASFENLSSTATAHDVESIEKDAKSHPISDPHHRHLSPIETHSLHYEGDDVLTQQPYTEIEAPFIEPVKKSSSIEEDLSAPVPPPRPPRKADIAATAEATYDPFQKVELYTRKSSNPNSVSPPRGGVQEKAVPVLGVQQAMAMRRRQEQEHDHVTAGDGQQPSTSEQEPGFSGHGLKSIPEVSNVNAAPTTSAEVETRARELAIGSTQVSAGQQPTSQPYRNPSFVRDSFSRSARRQPSLSHRQKQQRRQQLNGQDMAVNGVGPEFLYRSTQPSIRLKVPSAKRKKLFRSSPDAVVTVYMLNGQRVDVECHVDSTADDVFQVVTTHTNVMESHFFGLTYMKDGEHFFLEPEQKLSKFAPPGWRSNMNKDLSHSECMYRLFFRLKFYPVVLEFVKTEQTKYQIYLQLRRDVLDERLQCSREDSFTLAAIALQAEYGDRPSESLDYFLPMFYLPEPVIEGVGNEQRLRTLLAELHGQYAGLRKHEAETEYVRMCQTAREYGIHFHRIYRTKPSSLLTPSPLGDPDTGTPLWIGIMPRGIIIFEERGGERVPVSQHPWHTTQTLQFDHKRFVIVPQSSESSERNPPRRLIFFTDNYRKSSYFVRFAAAQHRFCMRQRLWAGLSENGTLRPTATLDRTIPMKRPGAGLQVPSNTSQRSSETDSGISREASPEGREVLIGGEVHRERPVDAILPSSRTPMTPLQMKNGSLGKKSPGGSGNAAFSSSSGANGANGSPLNVSIPSHDQSKIANFDETLSESMERRLENAAADAPSLSPSDYQTFSVKLYKDPQTGLGLTLVDGEIQGLKGVYVKSLTAGGPAELEGRVRIGDKITSINGTELESKTRYDAVQLVREALGEVELGILRLRSLYSSNESIGTGSGSGEHGQSRHNSHERRRQHPLPTFDNRKARTLDHQQTGIHLTNSNSGADLKQEAKARKSSVPDDKFGVPDYFADTSDVNEFLKKYEPYRADAKSGGVLFVPNREGGVSSQMYGGLGGDTDEEDERSDAEHSEAGESERSKSLKGHGRSNGEKRHPASDDEADAAAADYRTFGDGAYLKIDKKTSKSHGDLVAEQVALDKSESIGMRHVGSRGDIDWTNDLMNSRGSSLDSLDDTPQEDLQLFEVDLAKNEHGSLGIQVAGGKGAKKVYVKALVAEPALSCPDILPGDQLASVNGVSTLGMSHSDVVSMLKNATSPVSLGLLRPKSSTLASNGRPSSSGTVKENVSVEAGKIVETLEVTLEKPSSGSLGLSLAKPRAGAGIYVRHINPTSVAASDGRLKEGDRLWKINGELVAQSTPEEVVEKLKAAQGYVHLVIRRELVGQ